jgi:hypothetical protein
MVECDRAKKIAGATEEMDKNLGSARSTAPEAARDWCW